MRFVTRLLSNLSFSRVALQNINYIIFTMALKYLVERSFGTMAGTLKQLSR
jgi:hypothetical protein